MKLGQRDRHRVFGLHGLGGAACSSSSDSIGRRYIYHRWTIFLFGSLLNIGWAGLALLSLALAAVLFMLTALNKELLFYAFDARLAEISGVRAGMIHYVFIMLLVVTVTISARVVGIVLVSASLIVPGAVALRVCKRLTPAMAFAALIGFLSFELGVYASYALNIPPGSAIVLIQFAFLALAPLLKSKEAAI